MVQLFFIFFFKRFKENTFLQIKQEKPSRKITIIITLIIATCAFLAGMFAFSKIPLDMEKLAFQFSMPGIDEEIAYRGIMMGLLFTILKENIKIMNV